MGRNGTGDQVNVTLAVEVFGRLVGLYSLLSKKNPIPGETATPVTASPRTLRGEIQVQVVETPAAGLSVYRLVVLPLLKYH